MTPKKSGSLLKLAGLSSGYGHGNVLNGVDLEVNEREIVIVLGPNGAGKTTLLHILSTILRPDSGVAMVGGFDVARQPLAARERLGIVFQEPSLDDRLTVQENLDLHALVFGVPRWLARQRIEEMLELVELTEWAKRPAKTLSSGMKRRLEIARALIHDSEILLLDEPTVGLDAQTRERIWSYIRRLRVERDITVLVTTHYIEEVEGCDRVCIVDGGKVLALDTPDALKQAHGQTLVRVTPANGSVRGAISTRFADRLTGKQDGEITLVSDEAFIADMLAEFGTQITALKVEAPSLASVFLSLTGRDLRDRAAGAREQTLSFGRRGGEHTR